MVHSNKKPIKKNAFDAELMYKLLRNNVEFDRKMCFRHYVDILEQVETLRFWIIVEGVMLFLLGALVMVLI